MVAKPKKERKNFSTRKEKTVKMKLGMTFVYMRIITHDDLEKKQLKKIIAHYKTLLKRVKHILQQKIAIVKKFPKKRTSIL